MAKASSFFIRDLLEIRLGSIDIAVGVCPGSSPPGDGSLDWAVYDTRNAPRQRFRRRPRTRVSQFGIMHCNIAAGANAGRAGRLVGNILFFRQKTSPESRRAPLYRQTQPGRRCRIAPGGAACRSTTPGSSEIMELAPPGAPAARVSGVGAGRHDDLRRAAGDPSRAARRRRPPAGGRRSRARSTTTTPRSTTRRGSPR